MTREGPTSYLPVKLQEEQTHAIQRHINQLQEVLLWANDSPLVASRGQHHHSLEKTLEYLCAFQTLSPLQVSDEVVMIHDHSEVLNENGWKAEARYMIPGSPAIVKAIDWCGGWMVYVTFKYEGWLDKDGTLRSPTTHEIWGSLDVPRFRSQVKDSMYRLPQSWFLKREDFEGQLIENPIVGWPTCLSNEICESNHD